MDDFNTVPKTSLQQDFERRTAERKNFIQQNKDRYNINVSPEEYEHLNEMTKLTGDPHKTATAYTYSKELGIDFSEAWQRMDELNSVFVGSKFKEKSSESVFTTVKDHFIVGMNTTKMGKLGNDLMEAQLTGNKELEKATLEAYKAIVDDNEALLNQNREFWGDDLFNCAAESAPFTFAGMGLASIPYIGPALSFGYSSTQMTGLEYINMVSSGIKPETARKIAPVAGILEGVVEVSLGNIAGTIGAKFGEAAAGEFLRKNVINKVTTEVAKKLHYNGAFIKLGEIAMRNAMENLEEGSEEFVQEVISLVSGAIANSIDGNGHSMTKEEIAQDLWENAKGGFLGSILLSSPNMVFNSKAAFKDYKTLQKDASTIASKESFINKASNNKIFDGVSEEIKNQTLNDIWERNNSKREESFRKQEEDIAEVYTAEDFIEAVQEEDDEEGNVISEEIPEVYRTEKGKLFTETNKISEDHYKFQAGNGKADNGKNYGYIDYTINDDEGTVTINNFKMANHRESLRNEVFIDFAKEVEGYDIVWNPKGKLAQNIKDTLVNLNPRGKENGLNFFDSENTSANEDMNTRIDIAREFAEKSKLSKEQQKSIIALMETVAKRMGKNLTEYKQETFGDRILANAEEKNTVEKALSDKLRGDIDFIKNGMTEEKAKALNLRSNQVEVVNNALANIDDETKQALTEYALETGNKQNNLSEEQKAIAEKVLSENPELKKIFDFATGITSKSAKGAQLQRDTINGMRAVIYAAENADFSTFVHELAHVWRKQIDGDLLAKVEKAFNIKDHNWTRQDEENFARSFEQYLMTGKAKNSALKEIFEQLAQFMVDIYKTLKNLESQGGIKINDEIASVFDDLLGKDGSAIYLADQAVNAASSSKELEETIKQNTNNNTNKAEVQNNEKEQVYTKVDTTTSEAVEGIVNDTTLTEEVKIDAIANASGDELKRQVLLDFIEKNYSPDEFMQMKNWDQQTLLDFEQRIRNKESLYDMMPLFQLIGPKGAIALDVIENRNYNTSRLKQKDIAQQMKAAGKSADEIRRATGWEENTELGGIWTELTDGELKKDTGLYNNVNNILKAVNIIENSKNLDAITAANIAFKNQLELMNGKTVADYYDAKELFNAYPELKAIPLTFIHQVTPIKATLTPNGIAINLNYITDLAQVRSSLVHELQHVIQTIETNDIDSFKGMLNQNKMGWNELNSFLKNKLGNNYQINNLANVMQALSEYVQTDDYLAYYNQPMEIQARTAQKRADMNEFQKKNTSFADTDVLFQTFEEAKNQYPNIVDLSEIFNIPAPSKEAVLKKLQNLGGRNYATKTPDKKIHIYKSREKNSHVFKGNNYKNDNNKTRKTNRRIANNIEKLINNAKYIESELPKEGSRKEVEGFQNFEVPIYVNGHGYMVRLEGEVIKNTSDFSVGARSAENTYVGSDLDSNDILLKIQVRSVSNLYTARIQKVLFQLIGEKGAAELDKAEDKTERIDNLNVAQQMEESGKDAKTIRLATGWEKGADGKWKYEIADIKVKEKPVYDTDEENYKLGKLSNIIEAKELFNAYPQLKETILQIQKLPVGTQGNYTEQDEMFPNGIITISNNYLRKENPEFLKLYDEFKNTNSDWKEYEKKEAQYDNDEINATEFLKWEKSVWEKSDSYKYYNDLLMGRIVPRMIEALNGETTIAHEIQHAIQKIEGFAKGGSPESLAANKYNSLINELAPIYAEIGSNESLLKKIDAYKKANLELDFSRDDILEQIQKAESIKDNDAKLTELWDKLQEISKKFNLVYFPEIDPLFDFRITDIDSPNAREALWRVRRLFNERSIEDYRNLAGEVESRNIQSRMNLTPEQRRTQLLEETEDIARDNQIVLFQEMNNLKQEGFKELTEDEITEIFNGNEEIWNKSEGYDKHNTDLFNKLLSENKGIMLYLNEDDRFYTVSKNVKDNSGEWQLTYWDKQGPWGHKTFDDPSNALEELTRQVNLNDLHAKNENEQVLFQTVDLTNEFSNISNGNITETNIKNYINSIINQVFDTVTDPLKIQVVNNTKAHVINSNVKLKGARKKRQESALYAVEKIINNAVLKGKSKSVDLTHNTSAKTLNHKQSVLKYYEFETPIRIGNDYFTVLLTTERIKGQKPDILNLYNVNVKKEIPVTTNLIAMQQGQINNNTNTSNVNIIYLQTTQDLRQSAMSFDNWMDFMDFYESALFLEEEEKDAIPKDANASWYQNFWEMVHGISPTTQQLEEEEQKQYLNNERTDEDPVTKDSIFNHELKFKKGMLEEFLRQINYVMDADLSQYDPEEGQIVSDIRNKINRLKNRAVISNAMRVANGKPLTDKMRKGILTAMRNATRDYRGIYAILMNDPRFTVAESETGVQELQDRADEVHLEVDMSLLSPAERARIADEIKEKEIAQQIKDGTFTFGDDAEFYIKRLNEQINNKKQEIETLTKDRDFDFKNLEDAMVRDLLKRYGEMLALKDEMEFKKINVPSKLKNQIETASRYNKDRSGLKAKYESIYRAYKDAEKSIEVTAEIREKLNKIENLQNVKAEYKELRRTERAMADLKELRKKLIKRTMRSVKFTNVDYETGKALIAIQRIFDPNLAQGINTWIGKEEVNAREIWSDWKTGTEEERNSMSQFMQKSKRGIELMSVLENAKTQEDFNRISDKDKKSIERLFSKTDWIKELRLKQLRGEREGSIQLDIHEEERVYGTGEMDRNGNERISSDIVAVYSDEVAELIEKYFPQDMIEKITSKPFQYWSIGEMEDLAQQFNEVYKEGRNKLNAKKMREQTDAYRLREMIETQIRDTGIVINPDDPEDVKKKKQEKINKILGINDTIRGTQADKQKRHSKINAILHGYQDANIRRVARILDGYNEGTCTNLLYWRENDCYNRKERSKDRRYDKITKVMTENNITIEDLYKQVEINISPEITQKFSIDEILFFAQAYMNNDEYLKEQKKEGVEKKYQKEESAFQALCYGNLMSSNEKEQYLNEDRAAIEKERQRLDELELARIQGNKELEEELKKVSLSTHDDNGNLILPGEEKVKAICKGRYDAIMEAYKNIDPKFKKLQEAIAEDYSKEFERMNKASIEEFNAPVWREKWYLPLIRLDGIGDTHESRVKADLMGVSSGTGAAGTEKGFTVKRIRINPINQTAVETGLYKTWADSVERTEHFIAYAGYVRQLNRVFLNKDAAPLKQRIEGRYGNGMLKYIDSYIHEVANPNNGEPIKDFDKIVRMLRGNTAPAYLAWKSSSILKQALSSPAPYAQFISPIEYAKAAVKLCNEQTRRAIESKSEFMKNRSFDPIVDIIAEQQMKATNPVTHALKKFQTTGMQGLEWIDYVCVAPGWLATYEKEYNKLQADAETKYRQRIAELTEQNEAKSFADRLSKKEIEAQAQEEVDDDIEMQAVNKADDCVRLAQPSNRKVDLAPMFKNGSEVQKALLQFQTALNVIWQNIRYDIPYAAKNREYKQIVGMTMGYMAAGIAMGMLTEGSDPDDEAQERIKKYIYYSLTQFTDAVPVVGSATTNLAEKIVTGESGYTSTTDVFPTFTKMTQGVKALSDSDYKKAAEKFAEGLALSAGLPYSGTKEALRVFGIGDGDGEADFYPEALMGRRK